MKHSAAQLMKSRTFQVFLGVLVSGVTLYLAIRNITWQEVADALSQADRRFLFLALVSVAVNTLTKGFRWRVLLGQGGAHVPVSMLLMSILTGQMLNTVYPARIGDVSRVYVVGGMGVGRVFTAGSLLIEKILDMVSYMLLFFLLILLQPLPAWVGGSVTTFTLAMVIVSAGVIFLAYRPSLSARWAERLIALLPKRWESYTLLHFRSGLASLGVLKSRTGLGWLAFWSTISWGTAILNNYLVMLALGISVPWTASLLILIVLQAGISIPSVPGKFGVFEYSCVLALSLYGIDQATALTYGIVLHMIVLLPTTILGLIFFWYLGLRGKQQDLWDAAADSRDAPTNGSG